MKQQKNPGNLTVPGYLLRLDTMRFLEATLYYIYGTSSCLLRIQEAPLFNSLITQ